MKTLFKTLAPLSLTALAVLAGCSRGAKVTVTCESGREIIVKALDINKYTPVDTICADKSGRAVCRLKVEKGRPEFFYLYDGPVRLASLLLDGGDRVEVSLDTLGGCTVSGSEDCIRLQNIERDFRETSYRMSDLAWELERAGDDSDIASLKREISKTYIGHYRKCVKYVLKNCRSLTVVPVFYQSFSEDLPVFGQETDGITIGNVADSLATVYPESKYVRLLKDEAQRRMNHMALLQSIRNAEPVTLPEVELPDINAEKVKLSGMKAPLVILHFWTASDPQQCRFNLDVLKKYYDKYHSRGLDIYSVALDLDKTNWAKTVSGQNLPWVNVCDSQGANSIYAGQYNISRLPTSFIISRGSLVDAKVTDEKTLGQLIEKLL